MVNLKATLRYIFSFNEDTPIIDVPNFVVLFLDFKNFALYPLSRLIRQKLSYQSPLVAILRVLLSQDLLLFASPILSAEVRIQVVSITIPTLAWRLCVHFLTYNEPIDLFASTFNIAFKKKILLRCKACFTAPRQSRPVWQQSIHGN